MSIHRLLLVLAVFSPHPSPACVIVNINGSMDSGLARACLDESYRKLRSFSYSEKYAEECESRRGGISEENANEASSSSLESKQTNSSNNEDSTLTQDSHARQMVCMFVSGFSLAAGLLLLGWLTFGDAKARPHVVCSPVALTTESSSISCSSSDHDRAANSMMAESGSTLGNEPYRSHFRSVQQARQRQPEGVQAAQGQNRGCFTELPRNESTGNTKQISARKGGEINIEAAFMATPSSSAIALSSDEFWL